jgi:hypothetical protein
MRKKVSKILGVALSVIVLASMIVTASPVMATISQPAITVTPDSISTAAEYLISFDTYFPMAATDDITVIFPSGTTVPSSITAANVSISNDGKTGTFTACTTVTSNSTIREVVALIPVGETTGGAAHMAIKITAAAGVINPGTPGTYQVEVDTSQEGTNVISKDYTIGIPGMVTRYNDDGNYVGSFNTISAALAACNDKDELKLGHGTYAEDITIPATLDYLDITATGEVAETVLKGNFVFDGTNNTITGCTFKGTVTVNATGTPGTFTDCAFTKVSSTSGATLVTNNAPDLTLDGCTFDTTSGSVQDTALDLTCGNGAEIKNCTFTTDEGTTASQDTAIDVTGAQTGLMVKSNTFIGTKGVGYCDSAGAVITTSTVKDNTFDGFEKAIHYNNTGASSSLLIRGNTITNQTKSTMGAIDIDTATSVVIAGNTISDSTGYSVHVAANGDKVVAMANNFLSNAKGFKNLDTANNVNAKNCWWGNTAGPTTATVTGGDDVSSYVTYKPFITAPVGKGAYVANATGLDGELICGVVVKTWAARAPSWWPTMKATPRRSSHPTALLMAAILMSTVPVAQLQLPSNSMLRTSPKIPMLMSTAH